MVTNALGRIRSDAWRQGMEFNVNFAAELPLLLGDSVQLSQVVINLVCNAIDASADFPLERRVVEISTREISGGEIELSIRDQGGGMAPEDLQQMFTPFFSTKTEGLGIGLRLCRTIVEAHEGVIEGVNNSDGSGMTFRVFLPLKPEGSHTKV
jgi:signal transduction histidine kinase